MIIFKKYIFKIFKLKFYSLPFLLLFIFFSLLFLQCSTSYHYYRNDNNSKIILDKSKIEKSKKKKSTFINLIIDIQNLDFTFKIKNNNSRNNFLYLTRYDINKLFNNNYGYYYNNQFIGNSIKIIKKNKKLYLVSLIPLNIYLAGVLNAEMGISFPQEALKAQAIVSRTYIMEKINNNPDFLFVNGTAHQVFSFNNSNYFLRYVDSTKNMVIKYSGNLIKPFFCSSNGGIITTPSIVWNSKVILPYYKVKIDQYSKNIPEWEFKIGKYFLREIIERKGYKVGGKGVYVKNIKITNRLSDKRVDNIILYFSNGKIIKFNGESFRALISPIKIKSTLFSFYFKNNTFIFKGYGYGHGIGFSQIGAKKMAEIGFNYKKIIEFYFNNCYIDNFNE